MTSFNGLGEVDRALYERLRSTMAWFVNSRLMVEVEKSYWENIDRWIEFFKPDTERILEVGVIYGRNSIIQARKGRKCWCVDLNEAQLNLIKIHAILESLSITCKREDVCSLSFPDRFFDVSIATELLEHIPNDEVALKELCRVTKDDGLIMLSVPVDEPKERCMGWEKDRWGSYGHIHQYTGESFKELMKRSGLKVVEGLGLEVTGSDKHVCKHLIVCCRKANTDEAL